MMLSKPDIDLIELFQIPFLRMDGGLRVIATNDAFHALFGDIKGQSIASVSDDFSERKFSRRFTAGQAYSFRMQAAEDRRSQYTITLKPQDNHIIGFVTDTSEVAKSEAMLASYSALIEKQNREIKAKTEQINIWRARIQNELDQAAIVQDLLVPPQILTTHIDSRCAPVQELSGDFHDLVTHEDGRVTFISGDVAGKGIYAAIMLAQTMTAFRAHYMVPSLTELACNIISMMEGRFPDGLFVALTLVRQSANGKSVEILNLGNPEPVFIDCDGNVEAVASAGPAIGFLPAEIYAGLQAEAHSLAGRRLFVFTDGLSDIVAERQLEHTSDAHEVAKYLATCGDVFDHNILNLLMQQVGKGSRSDDVTVARFSPGS